MWHWLITSEHTFFPPQMLFFVAITITGAEFWTLWPGTLPSFLTLIYPHSSEGKREGFPTIAFFLRMVFRLSFLTSVNKLGLYKVTRPRSCHSHPLPVCKLPVLICWTDFWDYKQIAFRKKNMPSLWQPKGLRGSPPWNHQTMVSLRSL